MKLLNEQYLQQRIEELTGDPDEIGIGNNIILDELKQLLANCKEVEEIDFKHISYGSYMLPDELEEQGYKLIKVKDRKSTRLNSSHT